MGVQDRDWYHKDREEKERRERDPRTTEYYPKQFRGSRQVKAEQDSAHDELHPKARRAGEIIGVVLGLSIGSWIGYVLFFKG